MLSPIQNISFKRAINFNKINKQKQTKQQNVSYAQHPLNIGYYLPFMGSKASFRETIDNNYFQLPQIQFKDGSTYQLRPDKSQFECAQKLYQGDSVVFCAPTGTGKTAVAHYVMTKNLNENKKTIYTTPLKALANDKLREFRKVYGDKNVGLLTGDIKINTGAPIQIMTTEIYNNQAPELKNNSRNIATVIFDEAHYMGDNERGNVWENSILNTPASDIQILCLSATIGNSDDFASWIQKLSSARAVSKVELPSENRHVPLLWHIHEVLPHREIGKFTPLIKAQVDLDMIDEQNLTDRQKRAFEILFKAQNNIEEFYEMTTEQYQKTACDFVSNMKNSIQERINLENFEGILGVKYPELSKTQRKEVSLFLMDEDSKTINKIHTQHHDDDYASLVGDLQKSDKLPALIFKLSQNACFDVAMSLKENGVNLTTKEEKEQIEKIINDYRNNGMYFGVNYDKDMLMSGFAYHHAGELPQYRKLIEELFSKKLLKVVVATSTLSAGINMPARSVVISDTAYRKYNPMTQEVEVNYLTASDFHQMAGRAGRRGIDTLGHVILYNLKTPWEGFKKDIIAKINKGEQSKSKKDFDKMPDELGLAYELMESSAEKLRSHFKPDWCLLAQYLEQNTTNDNLEKFIDSSFKVHVSKNPQKDSKSLINKFINYENTLIKQGFLEKDLHNELHITPKGRILKMCQGANPLVLASLIYDEKLDGLMMEQLCQVVGYVAGSNNQTEQDGLDEAVIEKLKFTLGELVFSDEVQEEYEQIQQMYNEVEEPILRSQKESRLTANDINKADSFSGFATFLFSRLNISNKQNYDSIHNFRKITGSMPPNAVKTNQIKVDLLNEEIKRKSSEGSVYKLIAQSISTLKQIDKICDFALLNQDLYPNQQYYKDLKENAQIAKELLEQMPFNDEKSV